jgi:hypothetical protein
VSKEYSDVTWDDGFTRQVMGQFGASYLFVYRPTLSGPEDPVLMESTFLQRLSSNAPPEWLEAAASSRAAVVYRLRP